MRARKLRHLDERFDWYSPVIEAHPAECAGRWAERWLPGAREVRLDLGCGKGSFAVRAAQAEPDVLFIGMDNDRSCVALSAKQCLASGVGNAVFAVGDADDLGSMFCADELDAIYLNFCSPFPPAKHARRRLTHVDRLMGYRDILKPVGLVRFRTDSELLYEFSRVQFDLAGYETLLATADLRGDLLRADLPTEQPVSSERLVTAGQPLLAGQPIREVRLVDEIASDYEERLVAKGAKVHAIVARQGPRPESWEQTAELSLAAYLPEDLDDLDYVPYGMETTVINLRNRRAHERERAARAARRLGELVVESGAACDDGHKESSLSPDEARQDVRDATL